MGANLYDHICDHRHDWSTWRQDATRARKVIFAVAERSEKRQNDQKNVQVALGVVEAASSSLVTQTSIFLRNAQKIELNRKILARFLFILPLSIRLYHSLNGLVHS